MVQLKVREDILRSLAKFGLVGIGLGVGTWVVIAQRKRRHRCGTTVLADRGAIFWFSLKFTKAFKLRSVAKFKLVGLGLGVGAWAVMAKRGRRRRCRTAALADLFMIFWFSVELATAF